MIQGSENGINLFIQRTPLVGDVVVSLCFSAGCSSCTLNRLYNRALSSCSNTVKLESNECLTKEACFPAGSEESCVCYSVFLIVRDALCGTPLATSKSKVGSVSCGYNNGNFIISWNTKATGSAIRKSLGIAMKNINPVKCYSTYDQCIKSLGKSSNRSNFEYVACQIATNIKKNLSVCAVGNIKIEGKKKILIDDALSVLSKKLSVVAASKGEKPKEHIPCTHNSFAELKCTGLSTFITRDYISSKFKGVPILISDNGLTLMVNKKKYESISIKLKNDADEFIKNKYERVGKELGNIVSYIALSNSAVACCDLKNVLSEGLTAEVAKKMLKTCL